ncbi:MAG TPA: hypothetical protein VK110_05555 [Salinisphaeraceae bacterium]|nr:hypothetical protein [Salinisphaeraceae bacterium]
MKRRDFLHTGGWLLAGATLAPGAVFATQATVIKMISKNAGAAKLFGYFQGEAGTEDWKPMPAAAHKELPVNRGHHATARDLCSG